MKRNLFFLVMVVLLLTGCKSKQIIVHDIVYKDRVKIDTVNVFNRDSIFISQKGDTIRIEKYITRFRDRITIQRDTSYINHTDTFINTQQKIKTITVEKKLTKLEKLFISTGRIVYTLFFGLILFLIVKYYARLKLFIIKLFK